MRLLMLLALPLLLVACSASETIDPLPAPPDADLAFDGTVTYVTIEGGAWVLRDPSGTTYEPINLDPAFHEEGLAVQVWADERTDLGSYLMVGPIIEIRLIQRR